MAFMVGVTDYQPIVSLFTRDSKITVGKQSATTSTVTPLVNLCLEL